MKIFVSAVARVLSLGLLLLALMPSSWAAEAIEVALGYSNLVRADRAPETVIIGNNAIADATIATRNSIAITGHSLGSTNLILLDESGDEIMSTTVRVVPVDPRPQFTVRMISGGSNGGSAAFLCGPAPGCAPTDGSAGVANAAATDDIADAKLDDDGMARSVEASSDGAPGESGQ
jgi:hypothetical protein